jgi:hypothetical protein
MASGGMEDISTHFKCVVVGNDMDEKNRKTLTDGRSETDGGLCIL